MIGSRVSRRTQIDNMFWVVEGNTVFRGVISEYNIRVQTRNLNLIYPVNHDVAREHWNVTATPDRAIMCPKVEYVNGTERLPRAT